MSEERAEELTATELAVAGPSIRVEWGAGTNVQRQVFEWNDILTFMGGDITDPSMIGDDELRGTLEALIQERLGEDVGLARHKVRRPATGEWLVATENVYG